MSVQERTYLAKNLFGERGREKSILCDVREHIQTETKQTINKNSPNQPHLLSSKACVLSARDGHRVRGKALWSASHTLEIPQSGSLTGLEDDSWIHSTSVTAIFASGRGTSQTVTDLLFEREKVVNYCQNVYSSDSCSTLFTNHLENVFWSPSVAQSERYL